MCERINRSGFKTRGIVKITYYKARAIYDYKVVSNERLKRMAMINNLVSYYSKGDNCSEEKNYLFWFRKSISVISEFI